MRVSVYVCGCPYALVVLLQYSFFFVCLFFSLVQERERHIDFNQFKDLLFVWPQSTINAKCCQKY